MDNLSEKMKAIQKIAKAQEKKFGKPVSFLASENEEALRIKRLPDPSIEFELMLSGGLGKGVIVEYFGEHGSGKTAKAMQDIALLHKTDPDSMALWVETEGSFDVDFATRLGVDLSRLMVQDTKDILGAEDLLDQTQQWISSSAFDICVINSVAGLTPKDELMNEMSKQSVALQARMMSKFLRKIKDYIKNTGCTTIFINQLRTNVGVMYGELI